MNLIRFFEGKEKSPRHEFYYFNDDAMLVAIRFDNWKVVFCEQRAPKIFNLRMDPYERADISSDQYYDWMTKNADVCSTPCTELLRSCRR